MPALQGLVHALEQQRGYAPLQPPAGFTWAGQRDHWGSVCVLALARGDGLDARAVQALADQAWGLVQGLRPRARVLAQVGPGSPGGSAVQLGSFGVVALVFQQGVPPPLLPALRAARRGELRAKSYLVTWALDPPLGKVYGHPGPPYALLPGKGWLQRQLRA
jgi:hypothetical protein